MKKYDERLHDGLSFDKEPDVEKFFASEKYIQCDRLIKQYFRHNTKFWILCSLKFLSELFQHFTTPNHESVQFFQLCDTQLKEIAAGGDDYDDMPAILYFIGQYVLWYEVIRTYLTADCEFQPITDHVVLLTNARDSINESTKKILRHLKQRSSLRVIIPSERKIMLERDAIYEEFYRVTGRVMPEPMKDN